MGCWIIIVDIYFNISVCLHCNTINCSKATSIYLWPPEGVQTHAVPPFFSNPKTFILNFSGDHQNAANAVNEQNMYLQDLWHFLWILKDKQMHPVSGNIWAMWTDILPQALRSLISFCLPSCYSQLTEWSLSWWCGTPAHVRYCTSQLASVQTIQSVNGVLLETLIWL